MLAAHTLRAGLMRPDGMAAAKHLLKYMVLQSTHLCVASCCVDAAQVISDLFGMTLQV